MSLTRRKASALLTGAGIVCAVAPYSVTAAGSPLNMKVYKSPWCGCCGAWVEHLQSHGFQVDVVELEDLSPVKSHYGVNPQLESCHTGIIDGYVIEGHVPAEDVKRLLAEKPAAKGLSVPGMPVGSPGMEHGNHRDPYVVLLFDDRGATVFSRHNGA